MKEQVTNTIKQGGAMVPTVIEQSKEQEDFNLIKKKFGIKDDSFEQGIIFAQLVVDGMSRKKAYEQTFNVDKDNAQANASSYFRRKWIQELIRYLTPNDSTLYIGEIKTIIDRGMSIIRDGRASNREVTEAMKALQPYLKQEQVKLALELDASVGEGIGAIQSLMQGINAITEQRKMIGNNGEIVDVELID